MFLDCTVLDAAYHPIVTNPPVVIVATTTPAIDPQKLIGDSRLYKIAKCESGLKQFHNGKPLMSPTSDVGIMQINQVHWNEAKRLGLNIFDNIEDNIKMAKIILAQQGYTAWMCNSRL